MKKLFIDIGNSRTKWRLTCGEYYRRNECGGFADLSNYLEKYGNKLKDLKLLKKLFR